MKKSISEMKKLLLFSVLLFVAYFGVLAFGFFGVRYGWTNESGIVDPKNTAFAAVAGVSTEATVNSRADVAIGDVPTIPVVAAVENSTSAAEQVQDVASIKIAQEAVIICGVRELEKLFPTNAQDIAKAYPMTRNDVIARKMLFAVALRSPEFQSAFAGCGQRTVSDTSIDAFMDGAANQLKGISAESAFSWMNMSEWDTLHDAAKKDATAINRASVAAGIEPRLLVSDLVAEQTRLFHSGRELFKKFFEPLKILGNATQFSLGVMGVKDKTARETEAHLKDPSSPYYLGPSFEKILDFPDGVDVDAERFRRLTNDNDHYYNYLYAAVYLKQMLMQWQNAGFPMQYRPEIADTLYNVGFAHSKPKADPAVGGAAISVGDAQYSFGSLGYEFYYSGELLDEFPYETNK